METARLVLDFSHVLAWPAVVLGVAVLFKSEVVRLLRRVTTIEGAGIKTVFAELRREDLDSATREQLVAGIAEKVTEDLEERRRGQEALLTRWVSTGGKGKFEIY